MALKFFRLCLFLALMSQRAYAVEPDETLADPALEARARAISQELRCVVCQSQSIDDSNAPLAKDMRLLVRERLVAGDSDKEIFDYLVARYGDYVLLRPPVKGDTILLWAAPAIIFLIASGAVVAFLIRMKREDDKSAEAEVASDEETAA